MLTVCGPISSHTATPQEPLAVRLPIAATTGSTEHIAASAAWMASSNSNRPPQLVPTMGATEHIVTLRAGPEHLWDHKEDGFF